jgi:hypothetical protein
MTLEWVARPTCLILVTRTTDFTCLPIFADELAGQKSLRDSEDRGGARVRARPPGITQCQLAEGKDSIAPRSPEKEDSPNWKPFVGNPAGNQSRPPKPGQSAYGGEASLAGDEPGTKRWYRQAKEAKCGEMDGSRSVSQYR